jgi:hypothetical protein
MSADHIGDAPGWRDIATAPRDGTDCVLWDGRRARFGSWRVDEGFASKEPMWLDDSYDDFSCGFASVPITPTHWMPLPPPPSADSLGGDVAKRSEPDALPGDLREKVRGAMKAWAQEDCSTGLKMMLTPKGFCDLETRILSLIQSERGEP